MSVRVLEHVVRRAGLAVRLSDLATGHPVRDGITVTAWPSGRPDLGVATRAVTGAGIAGFTQLPGLRLYEDGSTERDDWFVEPPVHAPRPFVVRIEDATGDHLTVVRTIDAPVATPVDIALPRSPAALTPSGWATVVGTLVTQAGGPASWAVVELTLGTFTTGGVADERGVVVVPVPRAIAPTSTGSPAGGPTWRVAAAVRCRPASLLTAPGARPDDPPTVESILAQPGALVVDGGVLVGGFERDLHTGGPLILISDPSPAPPVLVVRPAP